MMSYVPNLPERALRGLSSRRSTFAVTNLATRPSPSTTGLCWIDTWLTVRQSVTLPSFCCRHCSGGIRPVFPSSPSVRKMALVHDLIPLMFAQTYYLRTSDSQTEYFSRIGELLSADRFLTISKTVAGTTSQCILGVDWAQDHRYRRRTCSARRATASRRGNNRTVRAHAYGQRHPKEQPTRGSWLWAILTLRDDDTYSLVITSTFRPDEIATLRSLAPNVVLAGHSCR